MLESTVYPGVTEEIMLPILEKESGLKCPTDFKIGYSPERINPGDKEHTIDKIVKVVSGCDEEALNKISEVYALIINAGVHKAPNIKTAEAAKVIENTQRDINIALMNELALIFEKLDIDTEEVLKAARTKWNFLDFRPGLVGGHCIGVDPYYLVHKAKEVGYQPEVITAGRNVNDHIPVFIAQKLIKMLKQPQGAKVLILGVTFKENVPDPRNSKVSEIIQELKSHGIEVLAHDPLLNDAEIQKEFGVESVDIGKIDGLSAIIVGAAHQVFFEKIILKELRQKCVDDPIIVDPRRMFEHDKVEADGFQYFSL